MEQKIPLKNPQYSVFSDPITSSPAPPVLYGYVKEHGLLAHETQLPPPPPDVELPQVSAAHSDETLLRIVEPANGRRKKRSGSEVRGWVLKFWMNFHGLLSGRRLMKGFDRRF